MMDEKKRKGLLGTKPSDTRPELQKRMNTYAQDLIGRICNSFPKFRIVIVLGFDAVFFRVEGASACV